MTLAQIPFLNDLPPQTRDLSLRVALAVLALVIIWLLRRLLAWTLIRPLRRLLQRNNRTADEAFIDALTVPARVLVMAIGLYVSIQILSSDANILTFSQHLTRTLVVIAVYLVLSRLLDIFAPSSSRLFSATGIAVEERLLPFARTGVKLVLGAIAIVIIVQEWGYDVSGLIAGLGIGGLAVSLAAQDTIANLFGFSAIVGDSPFHVGEYIKTPDVEGHVERVGIRSTRVRQLNQALVTVPNSKLAQSAILNWSRLSKRWYDTTIGVTYDTSSDQIRQLLARIREILAAREAVDKETILVHFIEFGDYALKILIRAYIYLPDWAQFTAEKEIIHLHIMDAIAELGLKIAFPSQSLYVEQMPRRFDGQPHVSPYTEDNPAPTGRLYTDLSDTQDEDADSPQT